MKKICLVFFLLIGTFVTSCRHPDDLPDLPEIKFTTEVQPIIISNCTQSNCHGSGSDHEKFSLVTYDDLMNSGIVDKGNAHSSKLYKVITGRESIMPPSPGIPLSDHQITLIYVWIKQGAKNN